MARTRLGSLGVMMSTDIQIVPLSRNSRDVMRFLKVSYGFTGMTPIGLRRC